MKTYTFDIKAFVNLKIRAETVEEARAEARAIIENMEPTADFIHGWNEESLSERNVVFITGTLEPDEEELWAAEAFDGDNEDPDEIPIG